MSATRSLATYVTPDEKTRFEVRSKSVGRKRRRREGLLVEVEEGKAMLPWFSQCAPTYAGVTFEYGMSETVLLTRATCG
jgi:hypothetical protein